MALSFALGTAAATKAHADVDLAVSSEDMERRLKALLVRYTEEHPDVQRVRRLLEKVREREARDREQKASEKAGAASGRPKAASGEKQIKTSPGNN